MARQEMGFLVPKNSPLGQPIDELAPETNEIHLPKSSSNVFCSTNLEYLLRNLGVKELIIGGVMTNQCVESAVRTAADKGFHVIVPKDGVCTSSGPAANEAAFNNFPGLGCVSTVDELVDALHKAAQIQNSKRIANESQGAGGECTQDEIWAAINALETECKSKLNDYEYEAVIELSERLRELQAKVQTKDVDLEMSDEEVDLEMSHDTLQTLGTFESLGDSHTLLNTPLK